MTHEENSRVEILQELSVSDSPFKRGVRRSLGGAAGKTYFQRHG